MIESNEGLHLRMSTARIGTEPALIISLPNKSCTTELPWTRTALWHYMLRHTSSLR